MRKTVFKILISGAVLLVSIFVYLNSLFFIENQEWKYAEGTHIGDWLDKTNIEISDRIIYSYRGKARIVFSTGSKLIIENLETGKMGIYVNKS